MSGANVLLVDDEQDFVEALARRLQGRGVVVQTAADGPAALELAGAHRFDAVVLDLAMPKMDGIETLKRLRELNPDIQVIVLTGHATVQTCVEAMKLGAVDLLEKPAEFRELLARIQEASDQTTLLVEKRSSEEVAELLRKKGW
jgi:DNA-binding NtrC family response regulator